MSKRRTPFTCDGAQSVEIRYRDHNLDVHSAWFHGSDAHRLEQEVTAMCEDLDTDGYNVLIVRYWGFDVRCDNTPGLPDWTGTFAAGATEIDWR